MSREDTNRAVLTMVREQLRRPSPPSTAALYGRAIRIDLSIRELTLRQFNARYPLRVRREKARQRARVKEDGKRSRKRVSVDRQAIREILVRFARDVVVAEDEGGAAGVIDVLARVEGYVEQIVGLTR